MGPLTESIETTVGAQAVQKSFDTPRNERGVKNARRNEDPLAITGKWGTLGGLVAGMASYWEETTPYQRLMQEKRVKAAKIQMIEWAKREDKSQQTSGIAEKDKRVWFVRSGAVQTVYLGMGCIVLDGIVTAM